MLKTPYNRLRTSSAAGFTLVELLVVIGIIAILAGVALGPITGGIKKAKESAAMQTTRTLALAEFQYANDNDGSYPDGTDAGALANSLITGRYVSDPGIFYISSDTTATKFPGNGAFTAANCTYDFSGVNGTGANAFAGVGSGAPDQLPLVWTPDPGANAIPAAANTGLEFAPNNPLFGKDGFAVCYKSNNAFFRTPSTKAGGYPDQGDALFIDKSFDPAGVAYQIRVGASGH